MLDLRIMHHYVTSACSTFPFPDDELISRFWTIAVPKMAFEQEFLLDAVLCATAFHLSAQQPNDQQLSEAGYRYYGQAVNRQRQALSMVDQSTAEPLCVASIFIMVTTYKVCCQNFVHTLHSTLVQWFRMCKGMRAVIRCSKPFLGNDGVRLLMQKTHSPADSSHTVNYLPHIPDLRDLLSLNNSDPYSNLTEDGTESRRAFGSTVYQIYLSAGAGVSKHLIRYELLGLAATVEESFLKVIEQEDELAIIILSHYFALLQCTGGQWWMQSELRTVFSQLLASIRGPRRWTLPVWDED